MSGTHLCMKVKVKSLSHVRLFATPWTVAHQVSPSVGFSRQEYWSGLPFPSPGESSPPRDRTQLSCIAGRRFTLCATREGQHLSTGDPFSINAYSQGVPYMHSLPFCCYLRARCKAPASVNAFPVRMSLVISRTFLFR